MRKNARLKLCKYARLKVSKNATLKVCKNARLKVCKNAQAMFILGEKEWYFRIPAKTQILGMK